MSARTGIRENLAQFLLLVLVNGLVGSMVGLERAVLPAIAEEEFARTARAAALSFIAVFGLTKAAANYFAGRLADRSGRRVVLISGWLVGLPAPFLLMGAPTWAWVVAANALLGISQGLAWSAAVMMKLDLAGPRQRGLATGLNESAGYLAVGLSALATGYIAARYGLRPQPFYLGVAAAALGTLLSITLVRETRHHAAAEAAAQPRDSTPSGSQREIFIRTTLLDPELSSVSQAGFVNNLNDGMAWGLFPLVYAAAGMDLKQIGWLAAAYPAVWGLGQLATGAASDKMGRKGFIVAGMWLQAAGIALVALAAGGPSPGFPLFLLSSVLLGLGTAMVYPTLLAVIGDVAHPSWRASAVGIYRLWRDSGYAAGALLAGVLADAFGAGVAVWSVAALTAASGTLALVRMRETLRTRALRAVTPAS